MNKTSDIQYYSAPGRVCLYGEHQDYLKLKVVPAAINLRTIVGIKDNGLESIRVKSREMGFSDEFSISKKINLAKNEFDYLRAIIITMQKEDLVDNLTGLDVTIESSIPIGSGLSSSAALLVAWATALNDRFQLDLNKEKIALLCFKAENHILGVNCGIMDQYSSSLGGIIGLDCDGPPYEISKYTTDFSGLIIGDSCVRRSANEPLTVLKNQLYSGIENLQKVTPFNLKKITFEELKRAKASIAPNEYKRLHGTIVIRDLTEEAQRNLAKKNTHNLPLLGELLTKQQDALRDLLEVSIPELDNLVIASLKAGALGAKLTGAGYGGCIIALAPGKEKEVAVAIENAGGKAIICQVDPEGGKKEK